MVKKNVFFFEMRTRQDFVILNRTHRIQWIRWFFININIVLFMKVSIQFKHEKKDTKTKMFNSENILVGWSFGGFGWFDGIDIGVLKVSSFFRNNAQVI